ncbi:MAG: hypothetical protein KDK23_01340 [Leptospiraceae bacterium]|nr:hypothetical protein [Leptospiraceae bacterium]
MGKKVESILRLTRLTVIATLFTVLPFCGQKERQGILNSDPGFQIHLNVMYYKGKPFNGIMRTELPGGWRETPYVNGQIHGVEHDWYDDGRMASERPHTRNKRIGIHRAWYPSGKMRFYYEYQDGHLHGESFSWHSNGNLYGYARYEHGQLRGRKTWRADGQIYANYVEVGQKEVLGLMGADLCNGVRSVEGAGLTD